MSQIISYLLLLTSISLINISTSQEYGDAICNGSTLQGIKDDNIIHHITEIPDDNTFGTADTYTITNPPPANDPGPVAQFLSSAVDPISGAIHVILFVENALSSNTYVGTLDTTSKEVTIIYPALGDSVQGAGFKSITFACDGTLLVFDFIGSKTFKIEFNGIENNITNVTEVDDGSSRGTCAPFTTCDGDLIAWHWENQQIYRISSSNAASAHFLFIRDGLNGAETNYTINDPDFLCIDQTNDPYGGHIFAMEYIGNDLFLISCLSRSPLPFAVRLLDTSDLTTPNIQITDIGSGGIEDTSFAFTTWFNGIIPSDNDGNVCKPPSCTPLPTLHPTTPPSISPVESIICQDKCDAFSVIVDNHDIVNDVICIDYTVTRLSDESPLCDKNIKYFYLGLCENDINNLEIDSDDLNGIIQSFVVTSNNRRRLDSSSDSGSDSGYRYISGANNGIKINMRVENELQFTLCMTNIFNDPIDFSTIAAFKRGKNKFACNDDSLFDGLPCINETLFAPNSYDSSGYNHRYRKVGKGGKKRKNRKSDSGERAYINQELENNNNWGVLSELDPYVRYTLVSIFIVSGVLIIIAAYICICRKVKNSNKNDEDKNDVVIEKELGTIVENNENSNNSNEGNVNNSNKTEYVSADEIVIENE